MEELLASLSDKTIFPSKGEEVEGEVIALNDKEVILDLGIKTEGVISTRDLGETSFKIGDKVKAFVEETENESGQAVLSLNKAVQPRKQPTTVNNQKWLEAIKKYQAEEVIKGVISKVLPVGVFVQLEEGVDGLIHSSKLNSETKYEKDQVINVTIDSIDEIKQRISLIPVIISTKGLIYK